MTAEHPDNKNNQGPSDLEKLRAKINMVKNKEELGLFEVSSQRSTTEDANINLYTSETVALESELGQLVEVWEADLNNKISNQTRSATFKFKKKNPHHTECMSLFYSLDKDLQSLGDEVELAIQSVDDIDRSAEVIPLFDLLDKELGGEPSSREAYIDTLMAPQTALSHSRLEKAIRVYTKETEEPTSKPVHNISNTDRELELDQAAVPGKLDCFMAFIIDIIMATSIILLGKNNIPEIAQVNLYFSDSIRSSVLKLLQEPQLQELLARYNLLTINMVSETVFTLIGVALTIFFTWVAVNILFSLIFQSTFGQRMVGIVICKYEYYKAGPVKRMLRVIFSVLNILSLGLRFMLMHRKNNSYYCKYSGTILAKRHKIVLLEEIKE